MREKETLSSKEWIGIKDTRTRRSASGDYCFLEKDDGSIILISEVAPINYQLLSEKERVIIAKNYERLFKSIDCDLQFVGISYENSIYEIFEELSSKKDRTNFLEENLEYIKQLGSGAFTSRHFFMILEGDKKEKEEIQMSQLVNHLRKIEELLSSNFNKIRVLTKNEIDLFYSRFLICHQEELCYQ